MKNTVQDKKRLSQPRLESKRIFYKKWLIFSETQFLTQNGVRRKELCFQQKIMKNTVQEKKKVFLNLDLMKNALFRRNC